MTAEAWEVSVAVLDLDAVDPVHDAVALPADDLALAAHIADGRPRRRFLAVRREVRLELGRILGMPAAEVPLRRGRNGKPEVAGKPVHFGVATRDAACLLAVSHSHPVGVEVAPVPERAPAAVLGQILPTAARCAVLAAPPDQQPREFALWWCRVQAAVRAFGAGLDEAATCLTSAPQEACDIAPGLVAAVAVVHRPALLDVRWHLDAPIGATR